MSVLWVWSFGISKPIKHGCAAVYPPA